MAPEDGEIARSSMLSPANAGAVKVGVCCKSCFDKNRMSMVGRYVGEECRLDGFAMAPAAAGRNEGRETPMPEYSW